MMAGQADRGSTGQTGPTARRPAAGRPRPGAGRPGRIPIPVEIDAAPQRVISQRAAVSAAEVIPPDVLPRELRTKAAYRLLITNGFSGQDAAGLIGYVVGLPPGNSRWSLAQVNRLLFLRALYSDSDWGEAERRPA
jgi:hypothetical protein